MPTVTFYNLPADKRDKLVQAAFNEFSRVAYSEVSINQIIKDAGISRGSFYQYFSNKSDLLVYILHDFLYDLNEHALTALQAHDGNLFEMYLAIIDYICEVCLLNSKYHFFYNLFISMRANNEELKQLPQQPICDAKIDISKIEKQINRNILAFQSDEDVALIQSLMFNLTKTAIVKLIQDPQDHEKIRSNLNRTIEMLKQGLNGRTNG